MKYELVKDDFIIVEDDIKLYRIKALKSFSHIERGQLGGYIESEYNLSQQGNCWVYGNAMVYDDATVRDNSSVHDNAIVKNNADVGGNVRIGDKARIFDNAYIRGNVSIGDKTRIFGNAYIRNKNDIISISNIGSRNDTTTFFRSKENQISVICGCFKGTIEEFEEKVKNTHKGNKHHQDVYLQSIKLAKIQMDMDI